MPETALLEFQFTEAREACEEPGKSLVEKDSGRVLQTLLSPSILRDYD